MQATKRVFQKLKLVIKGDVRVPWAEHNLDEWLTYVEKNDEKLAKKVSQLPYAMFNGAPHESEKTADEFHASVKLGKNDNFKGSGLSLHIYPDGRVVPSRAEYSPWYEATPATIEDVGPEHGHWLDCDWVAQWKTALLEAGASKPKKGKDKQKAKGSSSKQHGSDHAESSKRGKHKNKGEGGDKHYFRDKTTGRMWREVQMNDGTIIEVDYDEKKGEVYWDPEQKRWRKWKG